jgi:hypothetical protein
MSCLRSALEKARRFECASELIIAPSRVQVYSNFGVGAEVIAFVSLNLSVPQDCLTDHVYEWLVHSTANTRPLLIRTHA